MVFGDGRESRLDLVFELCLSDSDGQKIESLLETCFPDTFDGRTYFKQLPHARLLVRLGDDLVGHSGLDYRVIRVGGDVLRVIGIIDLCVRPDMRSRGLGSQVLDRAEAVARSAAAEFLLLFADRTDLYTKNAYIPPTPAAVSWLAIEERASHGQMRRDFSGTLMVKPLREAPFPTGDIDMLGYLF